MRHYKVKLKPRELEMLAQHGVITCQFPSAFVSIEVDRLARGDELKRLQRSRREAEEWPARFLGRVRTALEQHGSHERSRRPMRKKS